MAEIEQPDDRGDRASLPSPRCAQIGLDPRAQPGQRAAERRRSSSYFARLARLAEIGVIAILLAALLVPADRLDMAVGLGAEPGVAIGGRQADRVQPVDLVAIGDALALGIPIAPAVAHLPAGDAGFAVVAIDDLWRHSAFPSASQRPLKMRGSIASFRNAAAAPAVGRGMIQPKGEPAWPTFPQARVLILATDGFEQSELFKPRQALIDAGAQVTLASIKTDPIQGVKHDEKRPRRSRPT